MRNSRKLFALLLSLSMLLSLFSVGAFAEEPVLISAPNMPAADTAVQDPPEAAASGAVTILYTNDVHTYINKGLSYASVAAMKKELTEAGQSVLLVDAGDHIQGTAFGSMDKGKTIISLMNAAGYDLATLGNHEFDYGMDGCMNAIQWAEFPYVSCNFYHEKAGVAGDPVLNAYQVFELGGVKVAFVGITTPESFTKSTPAYFQNEAGEYIYGIAGGTDGAALYAAVQAAIDKAAAEADYVIALGHLGDDPASDPWNSEDVIANTTGLDAFIDGHSHSTVEHKEVLDKVGKTVVLTQTGEYYGAIGQMTITAEGIQTRLVTEYEGSDETVKALQDAWIAKLDAELGQVIGKLEAPLDNYDAEGNRLVRKQETNTGDFAADALYYLFDSMGLDVDFAIMNGGGVRNKAIPAGDITYKTCKDIHTFGNVACLQTITGQQLLDALEWGAKDANAAGTKECGGFLQVSGLKYTIDTSIPSTVQKDDKGVWTGGPTGEYRVKDVQVLSRETGAYEPLDLTAKYNLAGYNYTLRDLGDGFNMFDGAVNVLDYVMEDYMVLANYVQSFENGVVTGYAQPAGRITLLADVLSDYPDVDRNVWYSEAVRYAVTNNIMNGTGKGFEPDATVTRATVFHTLWNLEGKPTPEAAAVLTEGETWAVDAASSAFADVVGTWYDLSANWAAEVGLTTGDDTGAYAGDRTITRAEIVTILYRYAQYKSMDVSVGEDTNILSYEDALEVAEYAISAFQWACGEGIVTGIGNGLAPQGSATRSQLAVMLFRFCQE